MVYQDVLCRVFGRCRVGDSIDAELGNLIDSPGGPVGPKLFTYLRYDADLSARVLSGMGLSAQKTTGAQRLDSVAHLDTLQDIGRAAAQKVQAEHFAAFLH